MSIASWSVAQTGLLSLQQKWIKDLVADKHIAHKSVTDKFSARFFTAYLALLDGDHPFLLPLTL
jgi:hypothetical protein